MNSQGPGLGGCRRAGRIAEPDAEPPQEILWSETPGGMAEYDGSNESHIASDNEASRADGK
jgi:hypothetical protein